MYNQNFGNNQNQYSFNKYQNYEHGSYHQQGPRYPAQKQPFNRYQAPLRNNHADEHWCETCDRGFYSLELLEKHKQQHQKCNIDGCQFIAHPKVITKHIQMQHASGLYKKIANLNNPEEIQKWRDERKRRYPTKENIDKKAAEIKEKIDRGEKMGLNHDRRNRYLNRGNAPNRKCLNTSENIKQNKRPLHVKPTNTPPPKKIRKQVLPKKTNVLPAADGLRKLKPFSGIQHIVMELDTHDIIEDTNCNFVIEDDDGEEIKKTAQEKPVNEKEPKVCGALSSLICDYGSSDEDAVDSTNINNPPNVLNQSKEVLEKPLNRNKCIATDGNGYSHLTTTTSLANETFEKSDDEGPEETKIDKGLGSHTVEDTSKINHVSKAKQKLFIDKKPNRNQFNKQKHKIPSTLLQKLLRREVQQERNIILQCVRHIVNHNYFDKSV